MALSAYIKIDAMPLPGAYTRRCERRSFKSLFEVSALIVQASKVVVGAHALAAFS